MTNISRQQYQSGDEDVFKPQSLCELCHWYNGDKECPAFETKIPEPVWRGRHSKVLIGQLIDITYSEKGKAL